MKTTLASITFALSLIFLTCGTCLAVDSSPSSGHAAMQTAQELNRDYKVRLKYLLYLPKDYDSKKSWPLVLFLHGAGERGDKLEVVKTHGPPKLVAQGKEFPFVLVSPQCPAGRWWEPVELSALLDEIEEKQKIDKDRVYVTGLSMGGFGTWSLAAYSPKRFAAIVPICGGGEPIMVKLVPRLPAAWVFHGAKDPTVPIARSESMVNAMKAANETVKFTVYPDAYHDSWTQAYNDPKLFEWLLEQKRSSDKKPDKKP
jgi:predicted peptidase